MCQSVSLSVHYFSILTVHHLQVCCCLWVSSVSCGLAFWKTTPSWGLLSVGSWSPADTSWSQGWKMSPNLPYGILVIGKRNTWQLLLLNLLLKKRGESFRALWRRKNHLLYQYKRMTGIGNTKKNKLVGGYLRGNKIWVLKFYHNLRFWISWQFEV